MSIIAQSLKRLKKNRKTDFSISGTIKTDTVFFNYTTAVYSILTAAAVLILAAYVYSEYKQVNNKIKSSINLPAISELESRLNTEKEIALNVKPKYDDFEHLLVLNRLKKMFELAEKEKNLKYEGIYYFKKNNINKASSALRKYLKKHPLDTETAAYLSFALYKKGRYKESMRILDKVKLYNYAVYTDKAALYESMKDIDNALSLYKKAYLLCKNISVKSRIRKKIIVLEYYLENRE